MSEALLSGAQYCEVYEEPWHRFHLRNAYTNVYEIELPPDGTTFFHRHTEDTVYFVIADTEVRESFRDKPALLTKAPAGGTLCRNHREEHLIHQVTNVGAAPMHLVGAEALALPSVRSREPLQLPGHALAWESGRFRAYDVTAPADGLDVHYPAFGLLVALHEHTVSSARDAGGAAFIGLHDGGFVWVEPPYRLALPPGFRGIFAEWR